MSKVKEFPLNRTEFCERYGCSKSTFRRWISLHDLEEVVPNIRKIRVFTREQSKRIVAILG